MIQRVNISLALFVLFFLAPTLAAGATISCNARAVEKLGPIAIDLFHVQGMTIASDSIYITSVDKNSASGILWKIDRHTFKKVKSRNLAENVLFHPSGLQFDGKFLWLAIAVYTKNSRAKVLKVDPETLRPLAKFSVADHIGLIAADGSGIVYGANWDAKNFYVWKEDGTLIETHLNPTNHGYQDCKVRGAFLVCSGGGAVDFIRRDTWQVEKSFTFLRLPGNNATREGMDFLDGKLYFLPDDGAGTYIQLFDPEKKCK